MSTSIFTEVALDVARASATELADAFSKQTLTPVTVAEALLKRMTELDGHTNAIVHLDAEYTLRMAQASTQRYAMGKPLSRLDGVPVTIKDLSSVMGMPLTRGSLALDTGTNASIDTPAVARLREAGLVFLGKTATPEAGCKIVTRSQVHGVTANPYDLERTPGGSSGGAAAALALGFGPLALGSDGAGSIRIPASFTNVFGLKPSFGRVPAFPPDIDMPHSVVGPLTRTVADAALMLEVMSRPEPRDPFALPVKFVVPCDLTNPNLRGLRIAVSQRLGVRAPLVDVEVDALVRQAGPLLADAGATITEAHPKWPFEPLDSFNVFWAAACLATVEGFEPQRQQLLDPLLRAIAAIGSTLTISDYQAALKQRIALTVAATAFFLKYDLLVGPVMPIPAFDVNRDVPESFVDGDWSWCPYTYIWNMTGQPAASVPIGFTRTGLPVGVQIVGRMGDEATVLRAAAAIESRTRLHTRLPKLRCRSAE